jgi:hypothetical protein
VDPTRVFDDVRDRAFDLVKIDVEGHEDAVVGSLRPFLEERRIGTLLLEYHDFILRGRSINPANIEAALTESGMKKMSGPEATENSFTRLVVYGQA